MPNPTMPDLARPTRMEPRPENPHLQALLAEAPFLHRLAKSPLRFWLRFG